MIITLNNRVEDFEGEKISISEILLIKKFTFPRIIVRLNDELIRRPAYPDTYVRNSDILNIIHLISGG